MTDLNNLPWAESIRILNAIAEDIRLRLVECGGEAEELDVLGPVARKHDVMVSQARGALYVLQGQVEVVERRPLLRLASPAVEGAEGA